MGRNRGVGVSGQMVLWSWESESGSGHHEEEETARLIAHERNKVILSIENEVRKYIAPSKDTRQDYFEIEAEKLAELIKQHGKRIDQLPSSPSK